jgi:hypothetical protein
MASVSYYLLVRTCNNLGTLLQLFGSGDELIVAVAVRRSAGTSPTGTVNVSATTANVRLPAATFDALKAALVMGKTVIIAIRCAQDGITVVGFDYYVVELATRTPKVALRAGDQVRSVDSKPKRTALKALQAALKQDGSGTKPPRSKRGVTRSQHPN